jgi:hypothetical protein
MDRLTTEKGECKCFLCGIKNPHYPDDFCTEECLNKRIMKLADYENTGLTPDEILNLRKVNTKLKELMESAMFHFNHSSALTLCDICVYHDMPEYEEPCSSCFKNVSFGNLKWIHADKIEEVLNNG